MLQLPLIQCQFFAIIHNKCIIIKMAKVCLIKTEVVDINQE